MKRAYTRSQLMKRNSRSLVMLSVSKFVRASRGQIAEYTGLSRAHVCDVVEKLLAEGELIETGSVSAAAASLVVGETVVPGVIGIVLLGDTTRAGWGPVALVAFIAAVIGAVVVAMSPVVEVVESAG